MMPKRLVLCDDEPHILRALEFKFLRAGYDVRCADDGEEAWQLLEEERPDLLITDCQMPRLDGIGLVHRLRADERFVDLPVMMLTAKGLELTRSGILDGSGVLAIIGKPFSPRDLLRKVEEVLTDCRDDGRRTSLEPIVRKSEAGRYQTPIVKSGAAAASWVTTAPNSVNGEHS